MEGQVVGHLADGRPVLRYSSRHPIESMQGEVEAMALFADQGVGLVQDIKPAAMIVEQLKCETIRVFEKWKSATEVEQGA